MPTRVGAAAQRAVEGVRVRVREARQHQPGQPLRRPARAAAPGTTAVIRPPSLHHPHRRRPGRRPARRARAPASRRHASSCSTRGQGGHPGRAVVGLGVLGGGVRDPGRVAHEQHRGRDAGRGEDARVVPGPGRQHRRGTPSAPASTCASRSRSASSKTVGGIHDSSTGADAARPRRPRRPATRTSSGAGPRASSQAVTSDGMALTPFGLHQHLADRGHGAAAARAAAPGGGDHRGAARASGRRGRPAGWCRRGWPGRAGPAASGRAARSRWPRRPRRRRRRPDSSRPCSTCSSTKAPTRRSVSSSGPTASASSPAAAIASAMRGAVAVGQRRGRGRRRARR